MNNLSDPLTGQLHPLLPQQTAPLMSAPPSGSASLLEYGATGLGDPSQGQEGPNQGPGQGDTQALQGLGNPSDPQQVQQGPSDPSPGDTQALQGQEGQRNYVIFADDLTPSQTLSFDKTRIAGFVLSSGSSFSHTAILAKSLGIPCIVMADMSVAKLKNNYKTPVLAVIDADLGEVIVSPDKKTLISKQQKITEQKQYEQSLQELSNIKTVTKDKVAIPISANIGSVQEAQIAKEKGAEGVGLFRTEFMFLGRDDYPSIDEQYHAYRQVLEIFASNERNNADEVTFRTVDLGSDKSEDYLGFPDDDNPALGYRGVRIYKDRPELLFDQLTAIFRAVDAVPQANVRIMVPMVVSNIEVSQFVNIAKDAMKLFAPNSRVKIGAMIETPAAALSIEEISGLVDFVSVGTNDLAQYTFAVDRNSIPQISGLVDYKGLAFLKLMKHIVGVANKYKIDACICGNLAADGDMTDILLALGYKHLSVSSSSILELRSKIIQKSVKEIMRQFGNKQKELKNALYAKTF